MDKIINKFKKYLMDNVEMVDDVEVREVDDKVRINQENAGIHGMTHVFIVKFQFGWHAVSIDARKNTIRGWKKNVDLINKGYQKLLKGVVCEQSVKL